MTAFRGPAGGVIPRLFWSPVRLPPTPLSVQTVAVLRHGPHDPGGRLLDRAVKTVAVGRSLVLREGMCASASPLAQPIIEGFIRALIYNGRGHAGWCPLGNLFAAARHPV